MNDEVTLTWAFGGPLAGTPPEAAWTILGVIAAACAVFAWSSYRSAVVKLGVASSAALMLLRCGCLLALLFCLANPVRIERTTRVPPEPPGTPPPPPPPKLAVLIDRSDSMTQPDNRGRSRLDDALVTWRRIEKSAADYFAPARFYSFASDLKPAATLEEAIARTGGANETGLHRSVAALLKPAAAPDAAKAGAEKPDAIIVLTDGIDTTDTPDTVLRDAAVAAGVPVYFIAGTNRSARPEPFFRVREWRAAATALRNTEYTLEATFEAFSRADRTVPFSLWQGARRIDGGTLALTTGPNLIPRTFTITAGEPGPVEFILRLGERADSPIAARSITRVLDRRAVRVLVFQGALDWGFRYFTDALRTDSSFEFATIVTPDVGLTLARSAQRGSPRLGRLPDDAGVLAPFDCVVLAHPYPKLWSAAQQQALMEFVRGGGSILFMSPDREAVPQFLAAPIEELLPVRLSASGTLSGQQAFLPPPSAAGAKGGSPGLLKRLRESLSEPKRDVPSLRSFELTDAGRASPIFARAQGGESFLLPKFAEHVLAFQAKPGAEVLAIHPTATDDATNQPHILLATANYGRGRTAVLTTDALWRWKLSEPADARIVETFWQQLLLAIGRRKEPEALRFTNAPPHVRVGHTTRLFLAGVGRDKRPTAAAKSPSNKVTQLTVEPSGEADAPWMTDWTPNEAGPWELVALHEGTLRAHAYPAAVAEPVGELAPTLPALDALRALAGETGGTLLTHEPPAAWRREKDAQEKKLEPVTSERTFLRWNNWTVLGLALGFYAAELLLRRICRLL